MLPPVPPWAGMHPLIVHFPVALLLVVPLVLVCAILFDRHFKVLGLAALGLIAIGAASAFIAEETGEAAVEIADIPDAASDVLERHEHLASLAVISFGTMFVLYAAFVAISIFLPKYLPKNARVAINVIFLLAFLGGSGLIANTAHAGGRLVHQYGIRNTAAVQADAGPASAHE